jgi:signal transduction histidine kinase
MLTYTDPASRPMDPIAFQRIGTRNLPYLAGVAILGSVYFTTAKLGLLMDPVGGVATPVWPPTGISLAALCLFGYRFWPGVALGAFVANLSAGAPVLAACGIAAGNTLEALLGTYLLQRLVGFRGSLDRVRHVIGLVLLAAGLSTTVSATFGVASGSLGGLIPAAARGRAWLTWWLGDAMGDLVWAPLLFAWAQRPRIRLSPGRILEAAVLFTALVTVSKLVFGGVLTPMQSIFLQPYVIFPLLTWAAIRFLQQGTTTATFVVAGMAIWSTAQGVGPFAKGSLSDSLLFLQVFMGAVAVTMLVLAGGVSERRRAERRVRVSSSVARVLAAAPTLEEAIPGLLRAVCESLEWDCGNVWKVDEASNTLRHAAQWQPARGHLGDFGVSASQVTFLPGVGLAGRVWSEARPIWVPDLAKERNFVRGNLALEIGLRSGMGFPVLTDRGVLAVMTIFTRSSDDPDRVLLQTLTSIGSQIGQFIQRRRAEEDLRRAHGELEARIARRTEQLSGMNQALQTEIAVRTHAEDSLRKLSTRLLRVQDEERQRLARELHDSTAQGLAALSMNLAVVQGSRVRLEERAKIALDESEDLAERCSREIRTLSYLLHPPLLEEVGLPTALRWCADGFARRSGIDVELDISAEFGRLPMEVENALYRIVQECLTNVQRHSGSSTARIELVRMPRRVTLEVRDRGRGMPPGILDGRDGVEYLGVGLLGMRERVRQLGGEIRIESSDQGASIQVEMNVPAEGG